METDDPLMIVESFLDGERVAGDALEAALADPTAREHFVDLLVLREAIGTVGRMAPLPMTRPAHHAGRRRWLAAAAAVVVSMTAGYLAGQQVAEPPLAAATVEAIIHASEAPAAPPPTRVISLEPGVNWTDRQEGQ
ncbi:MAG TPA: hypothetical protein VLD67_00660 [Vicinamibacterales bacterium]|nr:hypothetical protein [Vicinamibacterales bacterium]